MSQFLSSIPPMHIGAHTHVPAADITWCEGDRNYSRVYFRHRRPLVVSVTLGILEARLAKQGFIRVNRSALVNVASILSHNAHHITLVGGPVLPIARRRRAIVREWLSGRLNLEKAVMQMA